MKDRMAIASASLIGAASYLVGGFDTIIGVFATIIVIDTLAGMLKAFNKGEYESKKFRTGFMKKTGYLLGVIFAVQVDIMLNAGGVLRDAVLAFFIFNEGCSIIENLSDMGVSFPSIFTNAIKSLNSDKQDKDDK